MSCEIYLLRWYFSHALYVLIEINNIYWHQLNEFNKINILPWILIFMGHVTSTFQGNKKFKSRIEMTASGRLSWSKLAAEFRWLNLTTAISFPTKLNTTYLLWICRRMNYIYNLNTQIMFNCWDQHIRDYTIKYPMQQIVSNF